MLKKIFTQADLEKIARGFGNSMLYSEKLRKRHPALYWCSVVLLIAIVIGPMVVFCLHFEMNPTAPPENKIHYLLSALFGIIGIVASACLGIALVNEVMRLFHGYLGWKVTVFGLLTGGPVIALCAWLLTVLA